MIDNKVETVKKAIADTQDGGHLREGDGYSDFILSQIEANTNDENIVDVVTLESDINYMISQLQSALKIF